MSGELSSSFQALLTKPIIGDTTTPRRPAPTSSFYPLSPNKLKDKLLFHVGKAPTQRPRRAPAPKTTPPFVIPPSTNELDEGQRKEKMYMEFLKTNFTTQEFMSALLSDEQVAQSMLRILVERSDFEKRFMKICTSKETSGSNPAMHLFDFLLTAEAQLRFPEVFNGGDPKVSSNETLFWEKMLTALPEAFAYAYRKAEQNGVDLGPWNSHLTVDLQRELWNKVSEIQARSTRVSGLTQKIRRAKAIQELAPTGRSETPPSGIGARTTGKAPGPKGIEGVLVGIRNLNKEDFNKVKSILCNCST